MESVDHRHVPRTKLEKLAYIHIEPNNGGIILDVSGEGLGFHSMARVEQNGALRFSLQERNRRIDVCGELVWTDQVRNVGGLRFSNLSSEARDQIRDWIGKSEAAVEEHTSPALGSVFVRALPGRDTRRFDSSVGSSTSLFPALGGLKRRVQLKLSGFSAGLATGLLFSALGASVIFFFYGHRRQVGESLIRVGERLAAKRDSEPGAQSAMSSAGLSPIVPTSESALADNAKPVPAKTPRVDTPDSVRSEMPIRAPASVPQQIPIHPAQRLQTQPEASPVSPPVVKLKPTAPTDPVSYGGGLPASLQDPVLAAAVPASVTSAASTLGPPSQPVTKPDKVRTPTQSELAGVVHERVVSGDSGSSRQMFFDLGRFKEEPSAQDISDKLTQLGLRTSVIPRGHLWMNSYQVLVGPYNNEEDERKINGDLLSHGYKPRPFEKGSRDFAFRSRVTIDRSKLPIGDFAIDWESYVANAKVKFTHGHEVVATADGRWIKKSQKYSKDEYVFQNEAGGSRPLLEIHFAGLDRALVFRNLP